MADDVIKHHISSNERIKWNKVVTDFAAHRTDPGGHPLANGTNNGFSENNFTDAEKAKLATVQANANYYVHPATHPVSMITGVSNVGKTGQWADILNKPTSMPANGGNASTVGGITVTIGTSRPAGPIANRNVHFNTSTRIVEVYNGSWLPFRGVWR